MSLANSDYSNVCICCTKKLFEFPIERDFANEKAFNAAQYPFSFQILFRILFFDIEVRFFGAAIQYTSLFIAIVGCERHLLFKMNCSLISHISILSICFSKLDYSTLSKIWICKNHTVFFCS